MHYPLSHRPDIDGLRAIAVVAVILYHYSIPPFSGGFVGVDVFFVISGYLITRIMRRDIEAGTFSFRAFWVRRARRILPALVLMLVVSMILGWFILLPGDYRSLAWQAVSAIFGLSNIFFWQNTGYFDQSADLLPLLHTWSLGVEEQFYLVWPAALFLASTIPLRGRPRPGFAVCLLAGLGLVAAVIGVRLDAEASFYLLPTRAWELLLGAALNFAPTLRGKWTSNAVSASGMLAILASAVLYDATTPFPGAGAILPCIGAAAVVWPKSQNSVGEALSLGLIRWVGQISYSLYLWHWPVLVLFKHFANGAMPEGTDIAALLGVTFFLATLSWRYVEQPFRKTFGPSQASWRVLAISGSGVLVGSLAIAMTAGAADRIPGAKNLGDRDAMWAWTCPEYGPAGGGSMGCYFGADWDTAGSRAFLWGDSHAQALAPVLQAVRGDRTAFLTQSACAAIISHTYPALHPRAPHTYDRCPQSHDEIVRFLRERKEINLVFLAGIWSAYPDRLQPAAVPNTTDDIAVFVAALRSLIEAISTSGRRIVLIGDIPRFSHDPVACHAAGLGLLRRPCPYDPNAVSTAEYFALDGPVNKAMHATSVAYSHVTFIPAGQNLCGSSIHCLATVNGEFIYRDTDHLRRDLSIDTLRELGTILGIDPEPSNGP